MTQIGPAAPNAMPAEPNPVSFSKRAARSWPRGLARIACTGLAVAVCLSPGALHAAANFKSLYTFTNVEDGGAPTQLAKVGDTIYGITFNGGGLFSFDPMKRKVSVLVYAGRGNTLVNPISLDHYANTLFISSEGGDIYAYHTLTGVGKDILEWSNTQLGVFSEQLLKKGRDLYGYTLIQGGGGVLTNLFKLDLTTKQATKLFTFGSKNGGGTNGKFIYLNGILYGALSVYNNMQTGGIFSYDLATGKEKMVDILKPAKDGAQGAGLTLCAGKLYGLAYEGGSTGYGTIFSFDPATGKKGLLYTFLGGTDAQHPLEAPLCHKGALYGTTIGGGAYGDGTVYTVDIKTGEETVLHSFNGTDGSFPEGQLLLDGDVMYGTTTQGTLNGATDNGTIFRITP